MLQVGVKTQFRPKRGVRAKVAETQSSDPPIAGPTPLPILLTKNVIFTRPAGSSLPVPSGT